MKRFVHLLWALLLSACAGDAGSQENDSAPGQPRLVGGPCEGCEAVFEYGDKALTAVDTLPYFEQDSPRIRISGTVYQPDGETPAADVIVYFYHTDGGGRYAPDSGATGWAARHGARRGWIKTGSDGRYTIFTGKAGPYPGRDVAAHIHPTILEPDGRYYYVADYYFAGDTLLKPHERAPEAPRGGTNGVLQLLPEGDLRAGERDFVLGANIPDYK